MPRGAANVSVNVLRVVAAVLVVVSHIRALFFRDYGDVPHGLVPAAFYAITGLGHEAVMVFFVLSGFWVGGTVLTAVRERRFDWVDYAVRRLSRLWLVALPGLLLTFCCVMATLHFFGHSDVAAGNPGYHMVAPPHLAARSGVGPAVGNVFFLQEILVPSYGSDGPLWSLAYEFWFYAMFPVLLLVLAARGWHRLLYAVLLVAAGWLVGWTILSYLPVWLLGAGVAAFQRPLSAWTDRLPRSVLAALRIAVGVAMLGVMLASRAGLLGAVGDGAIAVATACLVALLLRDVRAGRALRAVGGYAEASYSLYVVHLPLLALLTAAILPRAADRHVLGVSSGAIFVALLAGALVGGWLFASVTEFHTRGLGHRPRAGWIRGDLSQRVFAASYWRTTVPSASTIETLVAPAVPMVSVDPTQPTTSGTALVSPDGPVADLRRVRWRGGQGERGGTAGHVDHRQVADRRRVRGGRRGRRGQAPIGPLPGPSAAAAGAHSCRVPRATDRPRGCRAAVHRLGDRGQ